MKKDIDPKDHVSALRLVTQGTKLSETMKRLKAEHDLLRSEHATVAAMWNQFVAEMQKKYGVSSPEGFDFDTGTYTVESDVVPSSESPASPAPVLVSVP